MGLFTKGGGAVLEAEGELVHLREVPAIREAEGLVREKIGQRDEAERVAIGFPKDEVSLAVLQARQNFRDAEAAVKIAEAARDAVRDQERARIRAVLVSREGELRRVMLPALEDVARHVRRLAELRQEADRLGVGPHGFEGMTGGGIDWALEFLDEPNRECKFSVWRRNCEREGLL